MGEKIEARKKECDNEKIFNESTSEELHLVLLVVRC